MSRKEGEGKVDLELVVVYWIHKLVGVKAHVDDELHVAHMISLIVDPKLDGIR